MYYLSNVNSLEELPACTRKLNTIQFYQKLDIRFEIKKQQNNCNLIISKALKTLRILRNIVDLKMYVKYNLKSLTQVTQCI